MRLLVGVAKNKDAEAKRAKESREVGQEGAGAGLVDGEAEWVKVRVGGRKVNEAFLKEEANEVNRHRVNLLWVVSDDAMTGPQIEVLRPHDSICAASNGLSGCSKTLL